MSPRATPSPPEVLAEAGAALSRGDALWALKLVGRLDDARAMLLRGVAYAQIGDLELARRSLDAAEAGGDALTLARVDAARAEIDLAEGSAKTALRSARRAAEQLDALGDHGNAAMQRLVASRALVLLGDLEGAWRAVREVPSGLAEAAALVRAEVATRRLDAVEATLALAEARQSRHALLARAAVAMEDDMARPIARLRDATGVRAVTLAGVQTAASGDAFLVDTCRRLVRSGRATILLARRPVLFELLAALAEGTVERRDDLVRRVFGARVPNESHRIRLRVEIGRLRKALRGTATLDATGAGYVLVPDRPLLVLLPLSDDRAAHLGMLLGDGAAWRASELAEHAGISKSTALRVLTALVESGAVLRSGRGEGTRYARVGERVASRMLLLGLVPKG